MNLYKITLSMSLKKKLDAGKRIYGTVIVSSSSVWAEAVRQANLDFVFIDDECGDPTYMKARENGLASRRRAGSGKPNY